MPRVDTNKLGRGGLLLALLLAACQAEGTGNTPARPRASNGPAANTPAPSALPTLPPQSAAPSGSPTPPPLSKPPSTAPTPTPSGFVSPLPPDAFPPDPSTAPTASVPAPSPTPTPSPQAAQVLSNSLPAGLASLGGFVGDPTRNGVAVSGATIRIRPKDAGTGLPVAGQTALVKNASDGSFRLDELALGTYLVDVSMDGHTGSSLPTEVTLDPGRTQGYTVLSLVKNP